VSDVTMTGRTAGINDERAPDTPRPRLSRREYEAQLEEHRRELTGYCYRMLGSAFDAEDAVQEAMSRAWRGLDGFDGRASLRTWLYRIATNVCIDAAKKRERRARPMELGPASTVATAQLTQAPEATWLEPVPDGQVLTSVDDPGELAVQRETIRLAFIAALQHLPPKQRAVLVLCEVLRWQAVEVAALLDTTVAAVNSALQRARATLDAKPISQTAVVDELDTEQQLLLERFVDAFERYDMDLLATLLHDDAIQSMPPYELWLQGRDEVIAWMLGPGAECRGSRLLPTVANGAPAYGQYRPSGPGGQHRAWALQILEIEDGVITGCNAFLDVERWFPMFGLPLELDSTGPATQPGPARDR
jgi:RNA polymerase sigma-70 factor, ECF subfamily